MLQPSQGLMHLRTSPCSVDTGPETGTILSDCTLSDVENATDVKLESAPEVQEVTALQHKTDTLPTPLINQLPTEILIRIFEFAYYLWRTKYMKKEREDSPAVWDRSVLKHMALGYPEVLSHVCSLWREIILSSPELWWQLELYTLGRSSQTFLDRCSAFVPRTQNRDLGLIVHTRHCESEPPSGYHAIKEFCSSLGPRLRSFSMDNLSPNDTGFATSVIQATISHAIPGTLDKLYIKDHIARIILPQSNNTEGLMGWELPTAEGFGISQQLLDSIVQPIRYLWLSGQFFTWTSPAYHGLVELHLLCTRPKSGHRPFIPVSQLREILLACPGLRIFHININIAHQSPHPALAPVPLEDLVELSLRGLSRSLYEVLLPLLAPGMKPMQFTFQTQPEVSAPLYCPTILSFLRRTNVTSLYILNRRSFDQRLAVSQLLSESPRNLSTLGLERLRISDVDSSQLDTLGRPSIQLNFLCLRKCTTDIDALKKLADVLPTRVLKLHEPSFQGLSDENEAYPRHEIAPIFPTVKWVRSSRDMELWGAWEVEYIE